MISPCTLTWLILQKLAELWYPSLRFLLRIEYSITWNSSYELNIRACCLMIFPVMHFLIFDKNANKTQNTKDKDIFYENPRVNSPPYQINSFATNNINVPIFSRSLQMARHIILGLLHPTMSNYPLHKIHPSKFL